MFIKTPPYATRANFRPATFGVIALIHVFALLAPWTFSWAGLALFAVLSYMTGGFGITMAYHRLLTHQSFKTSKWFTYFLTFWAALSLQGGPVFWVATHRYHHKTSDQDMDPHSPAHGFLWAHMLWNFFTHPVLCNYDRYRKLAPDVDNDPGLRFFEKYFFIIYLISLGVMYAVGNYFGGPKLGLSLVVWGGFVRTVYVWHVTWLVNSATHQWGYRNYESGDTSTNNPLIAALTYGEGWHNNHHGDQRSVKFGHRWFEFDITYVLLRSFAAFGIVRDLTMPKISRNTVTFPKSEVKEPLLEMAP